MSFQVAESKPLPDKTEKEIDWLEAARERLDMTREELDQAIEEKMERFEGLVTLKSSAAILVCKDHDIEIVDEIRDDPRRINLQVKNLVPEMSSVDIRVRVVDVKDINQFNGGQVRSVVVKDKSGKTQLSFWDEDADQAGKLRSGDDLIVKNGYTNNEDKYEGSYCQDRYGVPGIQIGDSASVEVEEDGEWKEFL